MPKHARHLNATRHGLRADSLVLPWEDPGELARLREDLVAEHAPQGPTEAALVEEFVGILWRLRRVHVAETAAWRSGFREMLVPYDGRESVVSAAVPAAVGTDKEVATLALTGPEKVIAAERRDARQVTLSVQLALAILDCGGSVAKAAAALRDDARDWWAEHAETEEVDNNDPEALREFLTEKVLHWAQGHELVLANRDTIRLQAAGQAFQGDRLDLIGKYEVHLHRSLVRILAVLSSLQERRKTVRAEVLSFGKNQAA